MANAVKAQWNAAHSTYRIPSQEKVVIETRISEGPASYIGRECHVCINYAEAETLIEALARWITVPAGRIFTDSSAIPDYLRMLADAIQNQTDEQIYLQFAGPVSE